MTRKEVFSQLTVLAICLAIGVVIAVVYGLYCNAFANPLGVGDFVFVAMWSAVGVSVAGIIYENEYRIRRWLQGLSLRRQISKIVSVVKSGWAKCTGLIQRE